MTELTTNLPVNHSAAPRVHIKDGAVFANSRDVADFFGKEHCHVLRDIGAIASNLGDNEFSAWFRLASYEAKVGFGVKRVPAWDMTRDGFTLLVMGYTGAKAMQFKVAYIQRFSEMEQALKQQAVALPQTYKQALLALVALVSSQPHRQPLWPSPLPTHRTGACRLQ
ncbi:MAG: putative phage-encoded protein-like [Stygiobacter sp.]|nr:MAG: putative phage-encoded protein-like [Stygiobacter sp.]